MLACRILRLGSRDGFTSLLHLLRTRLKRRGGRRAEPVPLRPRLAGDAGELRVELSRGRRTQRGECGGLPDRRDGSGPCDAHRGTAAVFIAGAVASGLAVLGTAFATDFGLLLVLRLLPGIAGALAFLAGGVLDTEGASVLGGRAPVGIGVFYTGPGVGIFLAGAIVPPLLREEAATWPSAWIGLGSPAWSAPASRPLPCGGRAVRRAAGIRPQAAARFCLRRQWCPKPVMLRAISAT